jgi:DNA-binding transcriptional ArsR family regulator
MNLTARQVQYHVPILEDGLLVMTQKVGRFRAVFLDVEAVQELASFVQQIAELAGETEKLEKGEPTDG